MSPLEAVNWTQVTFRILMQPNTVKKCSRRNFIPNFNPSAMQVICISGAAYEPKKLFNDATPERAFGGEKWDDAVAKIEAHVSTKNRQRSSASAVRLKVTILKSSGNEIKVL
jgi:hypothetical protein